ncbi:MAG: hypothetical protein AB1631_31830 [Acidobacteriota bacterium]
MSLYLRLLDHPITRYLIIGTFSVLAAYLFWMIGGNFAKVVSQEPVVGVSFELGGAIAGFVSVFLVSLWAFKQLNQLQPTSLPLRRLKVFLIPRDQFPEAMYSCKVWIYDDDIGEERMIEVVPRREAGHLTIDLRDLRDNERFRIELRNSTNQAWQSEYYPVSAPRTEMKAI